MKYFLIYFIGVSLLGLISMHLDKKRAIQYKHRIKESTLWKIAILGGAVGSSLGMKMFRHKTRRKIFSIGLPTLAFIDIALFIYVIYLFTN